MRGDEPEHVQSDAEFWNNLSETVPQVLLSIRSNWRPQTDWNGDKRTEFLKFYEACKAHRDVVDNAIRLQMSGKPVPAMTDEQLFFLGARYDAIYGFLMGFSWMSGAELTTIFPKPTGTKQEVLCKLLIDWWWGPGLVLSFDFRWNQRGQ